MTAKIIKLPVATAQPPSGASVSDDELIEVTVFIAYNEADECCAALDQDDAHAALNEHGSGSLRQLAEITVRLPRLQPLRGQA